MSGNRIRLACVECDTEEYDGIDSLDGPIEKGWEDIEFIQSYEESIQPSPPAKSVLDWYTHLGVCPECKDE